MRPARAESETQTPRAGGEPRAFVTDRHVMTTHTLNTWYEDGGVVDDAKRRSRHCCADWADAFRTLEDASKTCSSALFMFMALFFVEVALSFVPFLAERLPVWLLHEGCPDAWLDGKLTAGEAREAASAFRA